MRGKNYNLELVRMISFLFVIVIHITNFYCRSFRQITLPDHTFSLLLDAAARVSVPCFFMISGALLLGREEPLEKHAKRLLRFLAALIFWSLLYYVWNIFYDGRDYDLRQIWYVPTKAHLWYLYAMIPIYLVLPFFQVLCRNMTMKLEKAFVILISAAVLINYLAGVAGGQLYYDIPVVGDRVYFYYVLIGYYLFKYRKHIRVSQRMAVIISAVSLLITFGSSMWSTLSGNTHSDKMLAYSTPFMILSSVSFFLFMIRLNGANYTPSEKVRRVIDAFGKASFGIYLIHIFFLDIYRKFVPVTALPAWVAVPALTVVIAGMSFGCIWLLHRFKWGRMIS